MTDAEGRSRSRPGVRHRKGRLEGFSDGVFAIAITLLVLDLVVPDQAVGAQDLWRLVIDEWPGYLGYLVSFATIGALWIGHSSITDYLDRTDVWFPRLNLLLLFFVCLLPFATRLLSEYIAQPGAEKVASTVYGLTLVAASGLLSMLWRYARRAGLLIEDVPAEEVSLLTARLSPSLIVYCVLIALGFLLPQAAVVGYFLVALFLLTPRSRGSVIFRTKRPGRRSTT